jgi:hypothetical protein
MIKDYERIIEIKTGWAFKQIEDAISFTQFHRFNTESWHSTGIFARTYIVRGNKSAIEFFNTACEKHFNSSWDISLLGYICKYFNNCFSKLRTTKKNNEA